MTNSTKNRIFGISNPAFGIVFAAILAIAYFVLPYVVDFRNLSPLSFWVYVIGIAITSAVIAWIISLLPLAKGAIDRCNRALFRHVGTYIINASFQHYSQPINASAIAKINGTVALMIPIDRGIKLGTKLSVTNQDTLEIWGVVEAVQIDDQRAYCVPQDRRNPQFWERLEERMYYDTSPPPHIYLTFNEIEELRRNTLHVLNSWRS